MSDSKRLTARQELFCQHYIATKFNGTQAAILAGYGEAGADAQAVRLLGIVRVKARIEELKEKTVKRTKASADDVFEMASNAAFFDIGDFLDIDADGVYLKQGVTFSDLPRAFRILIQAVKERKTKFGTTVEIIFVDKMKALDMLARFHSMYKDQVKVVREFEEMSDSELDDYIAKNE